MTGATARRAEGKARGASRPPPTLADAAGSVNGMLRTPTPSHGGHPRDRRGLSHHRQGGAGVGLHLAREIVRLHGGWIDAHSRPGRGNVFSVRPPRWPPGPQARTAHA
ncbi:MAG TPA: ATP-binding protein [Vicinamibacteria bacterium]|nr:ATP-binding protein [Vicinamibacteria bacterium]